MAFIYFYIFNIFFIYMYIYFIDLFMCYFKFRLAHRLRYAPCGASYTVHTDRFTAHNNNNNLSQEIMLLLPSPLTRLSYDSLRFSLVAKQHLYTV